MFNNIIDQLNSRFSEELSQHIRWRILVTKDTCYTGKVLKIIATNYSKDEPEKTSQIDVRYSRELILICIPLQNHSSVEEFNDYLSMQIYLAVQTINETLK